VAILAKGGIPVSHSCRVLGFSRSGFYDWKKRPAVIVSADEFALRAKAKQLFKESRSSLGFRGLMRALNSEGFTVGRYKVRKIMQSHGGLRVHQRAAYVVSTQRNALAKAAPNRVKMAFNPNEPNQVWQAILLT